MTGFPWIDAIMRQLRLEGWIHDLARKAVGSFLTRGCLWINWEEGFKASFILLMTCIMRKETFFYNRPFYSCVLSDLALDWKRG